MLPGGCWEDRGLLLGLLCACEPAVCLRYNGKLSRAGLLQQRLLECITAWGQGGHLRMVVMLLDNLVHLCEEISIEAVVIIVHLW